MINLLDFFSIELLNVTALNFTVLNGVMPTDIFFSFNIFLFFVQV